jgi:hypothetical protein
MKRMIGVLMVTGVLLSSAFCIMASAQGTSTTNIITSVGAGSPTGMTAHAQGTNAAASAGMTWLERVTNVITVTGMVTRTTETLTTKKGQTFLSPYYIVTEADGTTVRLYNNGGKDIKPDAWNPAIKPSNYVGKNVTVVGNGYNVVNSAGNKSLVIASIRKIDEVPATPAGK